MRKNTGLLLLIILYLGGVALHQMTLPFMEGGDEWHHYNYIQQLRSTNRLPDRSTSLSNNSQQASGQAPLYYWVAAQLMRLLNIPATDGDTLQQHLESFAKNLWYAPPDRWNRSDNRNVYLHSEQYALPEIEGVSRITRLTTLGFGLIAILGAYATGREIFSSDDWALLATAIFALTPMFIHLSAFSRNDIPALCFATLSTWQTLRLLRQGATSKRLLIIGVLLGLGGLTKINTLVVLPAVAVALLLDQRSRNLRLRQLLTNIALVSLPFMILFGPWFIYGLTTYGDPLGVNTHLRPGFYYDQPLSLAQAAPLLGEVYVSYWGKLASATYLHPATYLLLGVIPALSLIGYGVQLIWRRAGVNRSLLVTLHGQQIVVLGVLAVVGLGAMFHWLRTIHFVTGSVLYPIHITIALGITGGLRLLARRYPSSKRLLSLYTIGAISAAGLLSAPVSLIVAYASPAILTGDDLPPLQGTPIDFDRTMRFLGYVQPDNTIHANRLQTITLCWEVLQATEHPAAFSLKIMDGEMSLADRTSLHGLGRYPSDRWQPGDLFCDPVDIPMQTAPEAGHVYDVLLTLLNAQTGDFDWQATTLDGVPLDFPFITQVISPAGQMSIPDYTPTTIVFPEFAHLLGYHLSGDPLPGQELSLELLWAVEGSTPDSWAQFIHLIGPETVVLADGIPRDNDYPTWAWSRGEQIADRWTLTLPPTLPPGEYTLNIGFHAMIQGQDRRLPVMIEGSLVPDSSAPLVRFTLP